MDIYLIYLADSLEHAFHLFRFRRPETIVQPGLCGPGQHVRSNELVIIAILITVLVIFSNPNRISAEDKPQRSPELQVLDHFIGTWDHELTIKRLDEIGIEEVTQSTSVDTRKWSAGGTFVMIENSLAMKKNPDVPELIMMITYDPDTNTYPGCLMSGPSRTLMTGIWNERTDTMYWSGKVSPQEHDCRKASIHRNGSCRSIAGDYQSRWQAGAVWSGGGNVLEANAAKELNSCRLTDG